MKLENSKELQGKAWQFMLSGCTQEQAMQSAANILTEAGYANKGGDAGAARFSKGNRTMRILFGAFVKYNQLMVFAKPDGNNILLTITNESSGMSGGLIGMNQVKKEFARLVAAFDEKIGTALY